MSERMNVESFNLDHTKVAAPFVRVNNYLAEMNWSNTMCVFVNQTRNTWKWTPCTRLSI